MMSFLGLINHTQIKEENKNNYSKLIYHCTYKTRLDIILMKFTAHPEVSIETLR